MVIPAGFFFEIIFNVKHYMGTTNFYIRALAEGHTMRQSFVGKGLAIPALLCWILLLCGPNVSFGQCNPSGHAARFEFDLDPTTPLNLMNQQFCNAMSPGGSSYFPVTIPDDFDGDASADQKIIRIARDSISARLIQKFRKAVPLA
jgi:hypothetical protein